MVVEKAVLSSGASPYSLLGEEFTSPPLSPPPTASIHVVMSLMETIVQEVYVYAKGLRWSGR